MIEFQMRGRKFISLEKFMQKYLHYEESEIQEEMAKIESENKLVQPAGMDFFGMEQETESQEKEVVEEG